MFRSKADLEKLSTRRLLEMYRQTQGICYHAEPEDSNEYFDEAATIKDILDTREHVPKKEKKPPQQKSRRHKYKKQRYG